MFNPFRWRFAAQELPPDSKVTSYFEKLVRYIPADILAAYVAISGITESNNPPLWLTWGVFGVLLALTPLYVCFVKTDPPGIAWSKTFHWVTACLAFSAWVFAMGGPFATLAFYKSYLGSVVLILTTLIIPVMEGQFSKAGPPAAPPALPPAVDPATLAQPPDSQP